eukprot:COSAG04_NODE_231_length_19199_cov_263.690209_17_plen_48_part_00
MAVVYAVCGCVVHVWGGGHAVPAGAVSPEFLSAIPMTYGWRQRGVLH